jgi:chemotaxis regulatin CheY-phosphate phosphatase CheZ
MPRRGRLSAERRLRRRPSAPEIESRSVSEEITVLVNTLRELAAIRATAEDAAGRILDSAENLLVFADKEEAKKAQEAILAIMTACGFHDLVGQRVTKIAESLDRVIATRMKDHTGGGRKRPSARASARGRNASLLDGPSLLGGSEQEQARIDALFRDNRDN